LKFLRQHPAVPIIYPALALAIVKNTAIEGLVEAWHPLLTTPLYLQLQVIVFIVLLSENTAIYLTADAQHGLAILRHHRKHVRLVLIVANRGNGLALRIGRHLAFVAQLVPVAFVVAPLTQVLVQ
jgi:hypothetical protein